MATEYINMPDVLNTNDFNVFIEKCGQVRIENAKIYADMGDRIIKAAMRNNNETDFMREMQYIEKAVAALTDPPNPSYSISNMASCLLYAQTRDNFKLNQGYGKGSNINQYGDPDTSHTTVRNLMNYFSQQAPNKECGYDAGSTHGKWRTGTLPDDIVDWKLRIDIESDPKKGSIPAPLQGIHTAHFVPGVDDSGHVKLLVKPENWGLKKKFHAILHVFDFILTRFRPQAIKGLEGRQETKLTKEAAVTKGFTSLKGEVKDKIDTLKDKSLRDLCNKINNQLDSAKSKKGFDKPLQALNDISTVLADWINNNNSDPKHPEMRAVQDLSNSVEETIKELIAARQGKYSSSFQRNSEVRLMYHTEGDTLTPRVDGAAAHNMKDAMTQLRHQGEAAAAAEAAAEAAEAAAEQQTPTNRAPSL